MKKAKIMLLSLTIFAIVGGVLAFKAKSFNASFCTKTFPLGGGGANSFCDLPTLRVNRQIVVGSATIYATSFDLEDRSITTTIQCTPFLVCPAVRLAID
jgi:hypothetical protein